MASRGRTVRSNAVPESRRPRSAEPSTRPSLHVVEGGAKPAGQNGGLARLIVWTRSRSTSLFHIAASAIFLAATLIGALLLRTQMVENSFEAAEVQANITTLTQDVEEEQAKLDELQTSLPQRAEKMGMTLQKGSLTIDLSGYKNGKDGKR
ncbi:hypothetical protein KIH79_02785 [Bifidobacterium sp. 82T10]|uniref:Cell division protein FtsL n=1 Tax=Bifidobacterium miconis TaxID=2834435 RepID=A0ABS6WCY8_9BIFI|nr:hypothetical protein [Bifidobacterium miconis]MBW3091895.1 hypothetical protein [Bifidobacterium miconis]